MNSDYDFEGFDRTPEGAELVALLQKHAPPPVDSARGAQLVLARVNVKPRGRLHIMNWLPPLVGAAAAVALAFVIMNPATEVSDPQPITARGDSNPVQPLDVRRDKGYAEIVAIVREVGTDFSRIDAGLKDGLRVGDTLEGPGGVTARVTGVGVFDARVSLSGTIAKGAELRARATTEAQLRAASFAGYGGDPGAFFEFGALVSALPLSEARMLGISDGAAMRADEIIPSLLRAPGETPETTLAAQLDLRRGDVIIEVNGVHVRTGNDLGHALGWTLDPKLLSIRVLRNGKQVDLSLR